MTRSMPLVKRSGPLAESKPSSRWRTCQPRIAMTSRPRARPATAARATSGLSASGLGGGYGARVGMAVSVDGADRRRAVAMNRQIADGRMLATDRALRIALQLHFAEAHAEGVVREEPPNERLADAEENLHRFRRLHHSDYAWEHAQDTRLASGGDEAGRGRCRIETAVAGPLVRGEDRGHALELEDGAVDVGLAREIAGVIDEVAGVEIVRPVDDEIVVLDDVHHVVHVDACGQLDHLHVGIQGLDGLRARVHLRPPHAGCGMEHLTLKVRHVHHVAVHESHGAHARRGQIERGRGAQSTRTDEQHLGAQKLALSLLADLREKEMTAIALDLVAGE